MKKILLSFLLVVISLIGFAQFNLQFNQVITYSGKIVENDSTIAWIVPANKVWKIESMTNLQNYCNASFILNGIPIKNNIYGSTYVENYYSPIWLKAGDLIKYKVLCSTPLTYYLSIIEYNLIP